MMQSELDSLRTQKMIATPEQEATIGTNISDYMCHNSICTHCGEQSPHLIRGYCKKCAPKVHRWFKYVRWTVIILDSMYKKQTGQSSLADWDDFERYMAEVLSQRAKFADVFIECYWHMVEEEGSGTGTPIGVLHREKSNE